LSRPKIIKNLRLKNSELSKYDIETVIDTFCKDIEKALKEGRKVELRSFGNFFIKKVKEKYSARNPKTGELIYIPEKNKVRFKASKKLKKLINE
jgi:nucleoid DNA-binding protein